MRVLRSVFNADEIGIGASTLYSYGGTCLVADRRQALVPRQEDMRSEMESMHRVLFRAAHADSSGVSTPFLCRDRRVPRPRLARRSPASGGAAV